MARQYDAPIGVSLEFIKNGSYRYPRVFRTSDGCTIRHWHNRPYKGRVSDAVSAFLKMAKNGCRLDDVQSLQDARDSQILFVKRLNGLFEPGERGECVLR